MESFDRLNQLEKQNYAELKSQCQKNGTLFEDNLFLANNNSFYCKDPKMDFKWLRPGEIKANPKFCHNLSFPSKFSISQGEIGNLWFPGVVSLLTVNKEILEQVVPIEQSFDRPDYAGIVLCDVNAIALSLTNT